MRAEKKLILEDEVVPIIKALGKNGIEPVAFSH
jgi:hypothetical protein